MFPLPKNSPGTTTVCRGFSLSDDVDYESVFFGALSLLADEASYIPDDESSTTARDVASYFAEVIFNVKNCREIGVVKWSALATDKVPDNWLLCDGALYNESDYPELYDAIDPVYQVSATQFFVPLLVGRSPVGAGSAGQQNFDMGISYGVANINLSALQLPPHTHTHGRLSITAVGVPGGTVPSALALITDTQAVTGATGDGEPVSVVHPVHTLRAYIVSS